MSSVDVKSSVNPLLMPALLTIAHSTKESKNFRQNIGSCSVYPKLFDQNSKCYLFIQIISSEHRKFNPKAFDQNKIIPVYTKSIDKNKESGPF